MTKSNWMYVPVADWYEQFVKYERDGQFYCHKEIARYYWGKTNIPKVKRRKESIINRAGRGEVCRM